MNLPDKYIVNMQNLLGEDFNNYLESLSLNAKRGLRINKNYISPELFEKIFKYPFSKIEGLNGSYNLLTEEKIGNTIFHHSGMIYIQEPSSMLAANALMVEDGDKVLDLCAAPGGKTSQILENNNSGIVVANEIVKARANILKSNIERQGFKNALITSLTPEYLAKNLTNYFDKILVDAPCSGEGMFRKEPETITEWNEGLGAFNHLRQMEILKSADKMLKQGGVLVYSTCTFNIEENEKTVYEFCEKYEYEIQKLPDNILKKIRCGYSYNNSKTTKMCGRCFPFDNFGEGQFFAKLVKKSANLYEKYANKKKNYAFLKNDELKICKQFVKECLGKDDYLFIKLGNNIHISELNYPFIDNGVVNIGVCLGNIEKSRLIPHHHFFKAYGKEFINQLNLEIDDERIEKYLFGNEIDCENPNGYISVITSGAVLGGGKVVCGKIKNHYPKGLRKH